MARFPIPAIYDLDRGPVSYDFLSFVFWAQVIAGGWPVHIVFVPGRNGGWRSGDHKPISDAEREWRLNHILVPVCSFAGVTYTICPDRDYATNLWESYKKAEIPFLPSNWTPDNPVCSVGIEREARMFRNGYRPGWKVGDRALEHMDSWLTRHMPGDKPLVSITLRETYIPTRNSTIPAWKAAAKKLSSDYRVLVTRDTEKAWETLDWAVTCPPASIDLALRAALAQRANINISRNCGTCLIPMYFNAPFLTFGMLAEPCADPKTGRKYFVTTAEYLASKEFPVGSQYYPNDPQRRIVWEPDTDPDIIVAETLSALQCGS